MNRWFLTDRRNLRPRIFETKRDARIEAERLIRARYGDLGVVQDTFYFAPNISGGTLAEIGVFPILDLLETENQNGIRNGTK